MVIDEWNSLPGSIIFIPTLSILLRHPFDWYYHSITVYCGTTISTIMGPFYFSFTIVIWFDAVD